MERVKKILPPNLQDEKQGDIPAQVQQQMQQSQQMIEQLTQALNEAKDQLASKMIETEANNNNKLMIAQLQAETERAKLETQAAIEMAKIQSMESIQNAELTLKAQVAELENEQRSMTLMANTMHQKEKMEHAKHELEERSEEKGEEKAGE